MDGTEDECRRPDAIECIERNRAHKLSLRKFTKELARRGRAAVGVIDGADDECWCISCGDTIDGFASNLSECNMVAACEVCGVVFCESCYEPSILREAAHKANKDSKGN